VRTFGGRRQQEAVVLHLIRGTCTFNKCSGAEGLLTRCTVLQVEPGIVGLGKRLPRQRDARACEVAIERGKLVPPPRLRLAR
jgi:hypothetical protein